MRLSGFLPAMGRRVVVALGVAMMLMVASAAQAQTAAAAGQDAPDPLKFTGTSSVMVLLSVKGGTEAMFEAGFAEMKAGLNAAAKPELQAQGKSMQLLKVDATPPEGQPALYLLFLDPPVSGLSYNITQILYYGGAFDSTSPEGRKKVDELYAKFTASLVNQNVWPIAKK